MGLKRDLMETVVSLTAAVSRSRRPHSPRSIFLLRNNDIGDLLVATPLFEALKQQFPNAKVIAGVGSWNTELLANNPFVDEILQVNAPWHNQRVKPSGLIPSLKYLAKSPELKELQRRKFDIGIDFLGSPFGSLLMMCARIPWRLGVKGYAGGHSGVQQFVQFDPALHVAKAGLQFASLLGAGVLPEARPQLYLTQTEKLAGEAFWRGPQSAEKRIVIAPGGGYRAKCWPAESYAALLGKITRAQIVVIGGPGDRALAEEICGPNPQARNLAGQLSLREVFALTATSDAVICNSSMAMHVAAAFRKPCLVLLGEAFPSAKEHAQLWGYPETVMIGAEPERPGICSVDEAFKAYLSASAAVSGRI